tara:strand:+ start:4698 stop:5390 length:693 start_codon:yes stop_codon:yes gene_type:complete
MIFIMEDVRGFVFDMDGLMLDTEKISMDAWAWAFREASYAPDQAIFHSMIGHKIDDCRSILARNLPQGAPVDSYFQAACDYYVQKIEDHPIPLKSGIIKLLEFLKAHDVPRAVATSTETPLAIKKLARSGLAPYFDHVVGADQVAEAKPSPLLFLRAAEHLSLDPEVCLVLEDSGPGIRGARAAGMQAVLIPDILLPSESIRDLAHYVFDSLDAFFDVFEGFFRQPVYNE